MTVSAPGCDDAPIVIVRRTTKPRLLQFVYPYYENPQMLRWQIDWWQNYPDWLKQHIRVVIVDDGSPKSPAKDAMKGLRTDFPMMLFRIGVDVRWNWLAARNLGMHVAHDGWCILTDMDHVIPNSTLETVVFGDLDQHKIYRFSRREHFGEDIKPHPNSWLMTKTMFWHVGGYDEALSGYYGTDGEYRRRCAKRAQIRIMTDQLVRFEYQADSSTTRYKRKQPEDRAVREIVAARKTDWKPQTLSFPWEQVKCWR